MELSQGMAVKSGQRVAYVWYREQKVNGRVTRYALNKSNLLMISPLSNDPNSLHVANFSGEIKKPEDIADMLLMILPYAYNLDLKTIVGTVGKLKTGCLTLCKKHDAILCIGPYPHCSRIPRNGVSST